MAETKGNEAKESRLTPNRQGLYAIASKYSKEALETLYKLMLTSRNENVKLGASKALLNKALPDLQATEISGLDGENLQLVIKIIDDKPYDTNRVEHKELPQQAEIFASQARYKIVPKGRRFGLTKGAANDFIRSGLNRSFQKGLWVDTVNTNIDRYIERYFIPHLKKLPPNIWSWKKQDKIITIRDSLIDFRSSDRPENLEGFGYDKFFINEAGIVLKDEYLWNSAIRPMLWDYKASGVIGGTPKGKGVFYELAQRALDKEQERFAYFHFTSFDNPYLDTANLKEEMKSMPELVIKQEIYAEFLDDTGVVFRNVSDVCTELLKPPVGNHIYVMGVDLAKVQDYTVIAVYDRFDNKQVYQARFNKLEWPYQKAKIKEICLHYNRALINIDATGIGDPIADDLSRDGLPVEPLKLTNTSKKEIIEKLSIWIEQKKLRMLNMPETIQEFNNFTYDISSSGRIMYEAPVGFHDDIVIAHALAVWLLQPIYKQVNQPEISVIATDYAEAKKKWNDKDEVKNTSTLTSKSFSYEQLLQALYGVQDLFERAQAQFFLDRDTLVQVNNHLELDGDKITVGVKRAELTEGAIEVMQTYMPAHSWTDNMITYIINNVPIEIKIYSNDVAELTNPETIVYAYETFNVPNPVKTFLQKRLMILDGFLIAIICGLVIERFFYTKDMNHQVGDCIRALLSRNMDDFVKAEAEQKRPVVKDLPPDVVPLSETTDEQFLKAIKEGLE